MSNIMLFTIVGIVAVLIFLAYMLSGSSTGKSATRRLNALKYRHSDSLSVRAEGQLRKAVASRGRRIFAEGEKKTAADKIRIRISKTGKKWDLNKYWFTCGSIGFVLLILLFVLGLPVLLVLCLSVLAGFGLPHMYTGHLIKKRLAHFGKNFPDSIELIVRGLKSGLPVGETINIVAKEIPGPVGEEFKLVGEKVKIGKTMEEAMQETSERLGIAEFQFFVITLSIQRETGGNLAETLAGLADVLRKRHQMKLKIRAMSSESKASAYIVGSLPFFVFGMIWTVNDKYLAGFFTEPRLMIAGCIGAAWMGAGVFIMAKMVSFEI